MGTAVAKKREKRANAPVKKMILSSIKGAIYALVATVAIILIFAVIIKQSGADAELISVTNQIIKIVCIIIAALAASRKISEGKPIAGIVSGVLYIILGYLVFSFIEGTMGSVEMLAADAVMAAIIGGVTGLVLSKMIPKQKKK